MAKALRNRRETQAATQHYFGLWDDPDAALQRWLEEKDYLLAGRTPRTHADGLTLKELADRFLTLKLQRVKTGELTSIVYRDYYDEAVFPEQISDALAHLVR